MIRFLGLYFLHCTHKNACCLNLLGPAVAGQALMLSLSLFRSRLPSQICQCQVLEIVRSVWRGAPSSCSSLQSERDCSLGFPNSRARILREKLEQPSRTLCSLIGKNSGVCPSFVLTRVSTSKVLKLSDCT